jgi:hypothetical protein
VTSPLVLGYDVFAQISDAAMLPPMLRRSQQLTGRRLKDLLGDSGYVTGMDLAECATQDVTLYGLWKANDWSAPKTRSQFSQDRFTWHGDLDAYECPAGHRLKRVGCHTRLCSGGREVVEGSTGARRKPVKLVRYASSVRRVKKAAAVCSGANMKS